MPFEISQEVGEADFEELVQVEWASYEQPHCKLIRLFFPILGSGPDARTAAFKDSVQRQIDWNKEDPTSQWIKAVNSDSGSIVGAAYWHVFKENPYTVESDEECTWFPPGEGRELANSLMGQFMTPRMTFMIKPHVFLEICFVHPDFRRKGIGRLLMEWGLRKADEMGLETYIDATEDGVPLYETYGFIKAPVIEFMADKDYSGLDGSQFKQHLLPFVFWPMWRPVGGKLQSETQIPWNHEG